jgi:hypothetical protein
MTKDHTVLASKFCYLKLNSCTGSFASGLGLGSHFVLHLGSHFVLRIVTGAYLRNPAVGNRHLFLMLKNQH